jgi:hypothetical protein
VAFASTSAAIVVADDADVLDEDEVDLETDEDDTLQPTTQPGVSASAAAAPGKGDPHPSPAAFWVDKAAVPPALGAVSGNQMNFAGESEIRN